jgi:uncharacterized membrane protein HdeD (DUF308 family)
MDRTMNTPVGGIDDRGEKPAMNEFLGRSWWMLALRGAVSLLFGIVALMLPGLTLLWLVALFAAYALISGVVSISAALKNRTSDRKWWLVLLLGVVSIGAAVITVFYPALTALVLVVVMGANAIMTGILDIAVAIRLRKTIRHEWLLILAGIVSVLFGVLVLLFPGAGALAMVWLISFYAITAGILLLALAFRARGGWGRSTGSSPGNVSVGHA